MGDWQKVKKLPRNWICSRAVVTNIGVGKINFDPSKLKSLGIFYSDIQEINKDEIFLDITAASLEVVEDVYGGKQIVLEEDFVLDTEEINNEFKFDLNSNFVIKAGTYILKPTSPGYYGVNIVNAN